MGTVSLSKLFVLLFFLFMLTSCSDLDMKQEILVDGNSELLITYYLGNSVETIETQNPCKEFSKKMSILDDWTFKCEYDGDRIVKIFGNKLISEAEGLFIDKDIFVTRYSFTSDTIIDLALQAGEYYTDSDSYEELVDTANRLDMSMKYELKMPGRISYFNEKYGFNKIDSNVVVVNLLDIDDNHKFRVDSIKKNDVPFFILYLILVVAFIAFVASYTLRHYSLHREKAHHETLNGVAEVIGSNQDNNLNTNQQQTNFNDNNSTKQDVKNMNSNDGDKNNGGDKNKDSNSNNKNNGGFEELENNKILQDIEIKCRDYIVANMDKYSREQIKKALIKINLPEDYADYYIYKYYKK